MRKWIVILLFLGIASLAFGDSDTNERAYYSEQKVLNMLQHRATNSMDTNLTPARSLGHGQVSMTGSELAAGRRISGDVSIIKLTITPFENNTGVIYIGGSAVDKNTGYILSRDKELVLRIDNTSDVYLSSDKEGSGVSFIYLTK